MSRRAETEWVRRRKGVWIVKEMHDAGILIVHLSDIHFSRDLVFPEEKIERLLDLIDKEAHYLEIFFLVSGDIANSGGREEYERFKEMIEILDKHCKGLTEKITYLVVPGNHDIAIPKEKTFEKVQQRIEMVGTDAVYWEYCEEMAPFFDMAKTLGLFTDSRAACSVRREYGASLPSLDICLLNTTPFSLRSYADKELHFLPAEAFSLLRKKSEKEIKIVLMHHSPDWFSSENANQLNSLLDSYCDLVFLGHEHDGYSETRARKGKSLTLMRGGEMHPDIFYASEVCLVEMNLRTLQGVEARYRWDKDSRLFVGVDRCPVDIKIKSPSRQMPVNDFVEQLNAKIPGLNLRLEDIFVFPSFRLEIDAGGKGSGDRVIESEESFWDLVKAKGVIGILGGGSSGKTSMLSHLYFSAFDYGYAPLLLANDRKVRSLSHLVNTLVREQYGDGDRFVSQYRQRPKNEKILLVDDFDLLDKKDEDADLLNSLLADFGTVIFTADHMIDEGVVETIRANLGSDSKVASLRIKEFFKDKRGELVDRVCDLKGASIEQRDEIRNIIDRSVSRHRGLYDLSPDFILRSIQYYLGNGVAERQDEVPYNMIFEATLTKQLEGAIQKDYGNDLAHAVSECFVLMGELAARMHAKKCEAMDVEEAFSCVCDYSESHMLNVDPEKFVHAVTNAGIMKLDGAKETRTMSLTFATDTYLAYFIARWLDLEIKRGNNISKYIDEILVGVCFRINENILLFLAYLRTQTRFPLEFCEAAYEAIGMSGSLSFDNGNIRFLARWKPEQKLRMVHPEERADVEKSIAVVEEDAAKDLALTHKGPYDYSEDDCQTLVNRIDRAVKCLRLVGKSLVSLNEVLEAPEKELIVEALLDIPNRILYEMFRALDDEFDATADDLHKLIHEDNPESHASIDDVKNQMRFICLLICLGLYDQIAFDCSTKGTINLFLHFAKDDTNSRIQNFCMASCALGPAEFVDYAIGVMENAERSKNHIEIAAIRVLVNYYLNQHTDIPTALLQRCSRKIFGEKDYKKRLVKNRRAKLKGEQA